MASINLYLRTITVIIIVKRRAESNSKRQPQSCKHPATNKYELLNSINTDQLKCYKKRNETKSDSKYICMYRELMPKAGALALGILNTYMYRQLRVENISQNDTP